jgi:hypothetical protein
MFLFRFARSGAQLLAREKMAAEGAVFVTSSEFHEGHRRDTKVMVKRSKLEIQERLRFQK